MFKKIVLTFLLVAPSLFFIGCGNEDQLQSEVDEEQVIYESREGVVRSLGASIYEQGTHRFETDGKFSALLEAASPKINLDNFVGQEVEIEGIISSITEGDLEIIKVIAVTLKNKVEAVDQAVNYKSFTDSQFGFEVKYPDVLNAYETRRGAKFLDEDQKVIEIVVLENKLKQGLNEWLIDNYNYTADQLTRVSVGGLVGYQFQNTTGAVIYLAKESHVFTLAWYDLDSKNRSRNRRFYLELVQSFQLVDSFVAPENSEGEDPENEIIEASDELIPATADQVEESSTSPTITAAEFQRGWYYGDIDQKKPGTPSIWFLINSGTRAAMWRRPDDALTENTVDLVEATTEIAQLSSNQQNVFNYLRENINLLALEPSQDGEWQMIQAAFTDPSYVYVIYSSEEQTRRLLFVHSIEEEKVKLEIQAYFRPGESKDWLVVEGVDVAFGGALTVVDVSGAVSSVLEGYRQFTNRHHNYSLQYPKDWYWQNANVDRSEFSDRPFPAGVVRIMTEVIDGADYTFDELTMVDGQNTVYVRLNPNQSVKISAEANDAEILRIMAQTFESYQAD